MLACQWWFLVIVVGMEKTQSVACRNTRQARTIAAAIGGQTHILPTLGLLPVRCLSFQPATGRAVLLV